MSNNRNIGPSAYDSMTTSLRSAIGSVSTIHRRIDSGITSGDNEKFGNSGITIGQAPSNGYDEKGARHDGGGVRNRFLSDDNSFIDDDSTIIAGEEDARSRPVRNRLLDDTVSPPSYDEAATTAAAGGGRRMRGSFFAGLRGRKDADDDEKGGGGTGLGMTDEGAASGGGQQKSGWWYLKGKGRGIRGRFGRG